MPVASPTQTAAPAQRAEARDSRFLGAQVQKLAATIGDPFQKFFQPIAFHYFLALSKFEWAVYTPLFYYLREDAKGKTGASPTHVTCVRAVERVQRVLLHPGPQQEKNISFYREKPFIVLYRDVMPRRRMRESGRAFAAKNNSFGIIQSFLRRKSCVDK